MPVLDGLLGSIDELRASDRDCFGPTRLAPGLPRCQAMDAQPDPLEPCSSRRQVVQVPIRQVSRGPWHGVTIPINRVGLKLYFRSRIAALTPVTCPSKRSSNCLAGTYNGLAAIRTEGSVCRRRHSFPVGPGAEAGFFAASVQGPEGNSAGDQRCHCQQRGRG